MPTPKQVRFHFKRIMNLQSKLGRALREAYFAKVIVHVDDPTGSPCDSNYLTRKKIMDTCKTQLADAMANEILNETKNKNKRRKQNGS